MYVVSDCRASAQLYFTLVQFTYSFQIKYEFSWCGVILLVLLDHI